MVGSDWKPKKNYADYYTPKYEYSRWSIHKEHLQLGTIDDEVISKGEAFKTESDCKRYMNAKGWYNDKEWEVK